MLHASMASIGIALGTLACSGAGGGSTGSGVTGGSAGDAGSASGGSAAGGHAGTGSGGTLVLPEGGGGSSSLSTPVDVIITADNAYGFGYGSAGALVSYADKSTTQGVIAKFSREGAQAVFTGNGAWEACATGQDFDVGSGGPAREAIDYRLGICNASSGDPLTTSVGWVGTTPGPNGSVAFGEDNTTDRTTITPGNEFAIACQIDGQARWMWYDWDPNDAQSPFIWPGGGGNVDREFIIFPLGA